MCKTAQYAYQNNLSLNTPIGSYAAGTQVTVLQSRSSSVTKIRMPDGKVGWTNFKNVAIIPANYYTTTDYPVAVKEYYVKGEILNTPLFCIIIYTN